jgi:hypothetical protein
MSGLLERIVRRARASASSQLGPGTRNGAATTNGRPGANGTVPAAPNGTSNGHAVPDVSDAPTAAHPVITPERAEPAERPEPAEPAPAIAAGFLGRGRIRRRARYLRRLRELQLRDLGGFLVELRRHGRERPDLVQAKLDGALRTDTELRALERALNDDAGPSELLPVGIGGGCEQCGAIHGSADRFCASCGAPLTR